MGKKYVAAWLQQTGLTSILNVCWYMQKTLLTNAWVKVKVKVDQSSMDSWMTNDISSTYLDLPDELVQRCSEYVSFKIPCLSMSDFHEIVGCSFKTEISGLHTLRTLIPPSVLLTVALYVCLSTYTNMSKSILWLLPITIIFVGARFHT